MLLGVMRLLVGELHSTKAAAKHAKWLDHFVGQATRCEAITIARVASFVVG